MNDTSTPIEDLVHESAKKGKDPKSRKILITLLVLWLITLAGGAFIAWNAYFEQKETAQSLADQITFACKSGNFGPGITQKQEDALCSNAEKISKGIQGPEGPKGEKGDPGVVAVETVGCDGPIVQNLTFAYDGATQTLTITCNQGG